MKKQRKKILLKNERTNDTIKEKCRNEGDELGEVVSFVSVKEE